MPGTKAGGPVRSIYSLLFLLKEHYDFYLITTNRDLGSRSEYTDVAADTLFEKEGVHYFYFSRKNYSMKAITGLLRSIDPALIYLNSLWSYRFSIGVIHAFQKSEINSPILLAPRGMLGKGAMSLKSLKKQLFLFYASTTDLYRHVYFHATNEQEKNDILRRFKTAKVLMAPNINAAAPVNLPKSKAANAVKLFYLSRIARVKNLHFALEALKQVPAEISVIYDIYGNAEDQEYWKECMAISDALPPNIKVSYKGELQFHDVQKNIASYHALLLPTLNENFGHSIVESLMSGCLVVTSDQTPWKDLQDAGAGFTLSLADTAPFTACVVQIAKMDDEEYERHRLQAIHYISNKLNIRQSVEQYRTLMDECIKNRPFQV